MPEGGGDGTPFVEARVMCSSPLFYAPRATSPTPAHRARGYALGAFLMLAATGAAAAE